MYIIYLEISLPLQLILSSSSTPTDHQYDPVHGHYISVELPANGMGALLDVPCDQYPCGVCRPEYWSYSRRLVRCGERNFPGACSDHTDDDVRWLWRHAARSAQLPKVGQSYIALTLRSGGLYSCHLWSRSWRFRLRRGSLLPLQVKLLFENKMHFQN